MQRSLLVLLALALAVGVWFLLGRPDPEASVAAPSTPAADVATEEVGPSEGAALSHSSEPESVERAEVEAEPIAAPVEPAVAETRIVRGRIELERGGTRYGSESGTAQVTVWKERSGRGRAVDVVDGRFAIELEGEDVAAFTRLTLRWARLGGRPATAADVEVVQEGDEWVLVARAVEVPTLRVLASEDATELRDVSLFRRPGRPRYSNAGDPLHPGSGGREPRRIQGPADSPLLLEIDDDALRFGRLEAVVGAPGRAWKAVEIPLDRDAGYEQLVELDRAGAIDVRVTGVPPDADLVLRLRQQHTVGYERSLPRDVELSLDGMRAGTWVVQAERGERHWEAVPFGSATVEVVPGETVVAEIAVDPDAAVRAVEHAVTLELSLDAAWEVEQTSCKLVRVEPADGERLDDHHRIGFEPSADGATLVGAPLALELVAGEYGIYLHDLGPLLFFEVARDGPVELHVGAPRAVEVVTVAAGSGAPISDLNVSYYPDEVHRLGGWSSVSFESEEGANVHRAQALPGKIHVRASGSEIAMTSEEFVVGEGSNRLVMELDPPTEVEIRYLHAGQRIEPSDRFDSATAETLEGERVMGGRRTGGGRSWLIFSGGGEYRFTAPAIDGYVTPEPITRLVLKGESSVLEFHYERRD